MKTKTIYFPEINKEINYLIGTNALDNFLVIDEALEDDIWFHSKDSSSCHIVCLLPNDVKIDEQNKKLLIKKGAELCVCNTHKLTLIYKVPIIYTEIKNIYKTKIPGLVKTFFTETIIITNKPKEIGISSEKKYLKKNKK